MQILLDKHHKDLEYQDLVDESLVPNHIEQDNFQEIIKNNKPEDSKYECELERIPVKFSNAENI